MTTIVLAFPPPAERLEQFKKAYPQVRFVPAKAVPGSWRGEVEPKDLAEADAYFGGISPEHYEHAGDKLRWIQSPSAGVEWMWSVPGLQDSDIVVTNARGAHAATIAEHTFALLLTLTRAMWAHRDHQQKHEWARGDIPGMNGIKGLTMGIVGFGNIGRAIARRANGFEMELLAVDAQTVAPSEGVREVWRLDRLDDLCRQVDVLTISAPITPQTRGMIGKEQIALLKKGSYVVAVSRGGIINEPALVDALKSGHLAGAGLDVTETEPLPAESPLWDAPNCVITPHDSGSSRLTTELMWSIFFENVGHFVKGEPLVNVVDKKLGY